MIVNIYIYIYWGGGEGREVLHPKHLLYGLASSYKLTALRDNLTQRACMCSMKSSRAVMYVCKIRIII